MMVMILVLRGHAAGYFDFYGAEARAWAAVYADDFFDGGRVGGVVVMVLFCFGGCEGEPAHVCRCPDAR